MLCFPATKQTMQVQLQTFYECVFFHKNNKKLHCCTVVTKYSHEFQSFPLAAFNKYRAAVVSRHSLQICVRYGSRLKRHIPQYAILLLDLQSLHCTGLCIAMDKPPDVPVYGAKQWQSDHNIVQALLSNNKMMRMQQRSLTKLSHSRWTNHTRSE